MDIQEKEKSTEQNETQKNELTESVDAQKGSATSTEDNSTEIEPEDNPDDATTEGIP